MISRSIYVGNILSETDACCDGLKQNGELLNKRRYNDMNMYNSQTFCLGEIDFFFNKIDYNMNIGYLQLLFIEYQN